MNKNEQSLGEMWDQHMCNDSTRRRRERKRQKKIFKEVTAEKFPNLMKSTTLRIHAMAWFLLVAYSKMQDELKWKKKSEREMN